MDIEHSLAGMTQAGLTGMFSASTWQAPRWTRSICETRHELSRSEPQILRWPISCPEPRDVRALIERLRKRCDAALEPELSSKHYPSPRRNIIPRRGFVMGRPALYARARRGRHAQPQGDPATKERPPRFDECSILPAAAAGSSGRRDPTGTALGSARSISNSGGAEAPPTCFRADNRVLRCFGCRLRWHSRPRWHGRQHDH